MNTARIVALIVCTGLGLVFAPPVDVRSQGASCLVSTAAGDIQGQDRGASCAFLGIPFAAPPVGTLRWRPPQPATWTGALDATTAPAGCPAINPAGVAVGNEDCLKLNIWVRDPLPLAPAPVIVWLHTGAFTSASSTFPSHNGQRLAEETGAIVVAPNYRLGPLGFLAHPALGAEDAAHPVSGNYGLLDQRAALEWVRDNIAAFGGDPGRVTLTGTSAGGQSVGLHLVSPGSAGLFSRAAIHSAYPTVREATLDEAMAVGDTFARALGCTDPSTVLSCMRARTPVEILRAVPAASEQVVEPAGVAWRPVVDGVEIPDQPRTLFETGAFNRVPTIAGTTRDEGWVFVIRSFASGVTPAQYETWVQSEFGSDASRVLSAYPLADYSSPADAMGRLVGDAQFACETRRLARAVEQTGTPMYVYSYEHEIDALSPDRVIHGVESNILFGNAYVPPIFAPHALDATDLALHAAMAGYWSRFAATGNPNTDDDTVVHWPAFKHPTSGDGRGSDKHLVLAPFIREDKRLRESSCDFWEPLFLRSLTGAVPASLQ